MTNIKHTSLTSNIVNEAAYAQLSELYRWQDNSGRDIRGKVPGSEDGFILSPHCEWDVPAFNLGIDSLGIVNRSISFFAYRLGHDIQVCRIKGEPVAAEQLPDEDLSMIMRVLPAAVNRLQEIKHSQPAKRSFWRRHRS